MERISSFKDFQSIYTERSQARLSEENEIKRDAIAERVKNILSEMEISSLMFQKLRSCYSINTVKYAICKQYQGIY